MKNKKGWIKILEAVIAILLIVAVISTILIKEDSNKYIFKDRVNELENSILQELQINNTFRTEILNQEDSIKFGEQGFPKQTEEYLISSVPNGLNCTLNICQIEEECNLAGEEGPGENTEIYVQSTLISANLDTYNPKRVMIFCWKV